MAALSAADRTEVGRRIMDALSSAREATVLTKAQILAAINATDDFVEANAAAYNAALPAAARNNLTAAQKARLFAMVTLRRYEVA